jgi:hypothetical protein
VTMDDRDAIMIRNQVEALLGHAKLQGDAVDLMRAFLDHDGDHACWNRAAHDLGWNRARLRRALYAIRSVARGTL